MIQWIKEHPFEIFFTGLVLFIIVVFGIAIHSDIQNERQTRLDQIECIERTDDAEWCLDTIN